MRLFLFALLACPENSPTDDKPGTGGDETGTTDCALLLSYVDADADGYGNPATGAFACTIPNDNVTNGLDCDDNHAEISPGATETCDESDADEDCDGTADDADSSVDPAGFTNFYADADADGFGDPDVVIPACDALGGRVTDMSDCDDADVAVSPSATEICDALNADENCSGFADDADPDVDPVGFTTFYTDFDADGYGDPSTPTAACDLPGGATSDDSDCDDANPEISPAAEELCDELNIDENCNGYADDADGGVDISGYADFFLDADGDGYGNPSAPIAACDVPGGAVTDASDCDDTESAISPRATESCDELNIDENCNELADDADSGVDPTGFTTFYADVDADGYGDPGASISACDQPASASADGSDCDDYDPAVSPAENEVCDDLDVDENCNAVSDDADVDVDASGFTTFYADVDADGFGDVASPLGSCDEPVGAVLDASDCQDIDPAVSPAAVEVCDELDTDEDCSGMADDADTGLDTTTFNTFYTDADADGYGNITRSTAACDAPPGSVVDATDCDDADGTVSPGATETCDSLDLD